MNPEHGRNERTEKIVIPDDVRKRLKDVIEGDVKALGFELGRCGISDTEIDDPNKWPEEIRKGFEDIEVLLDRFGLNIDVCDAFAAGFVRGYAESPSRSPTEKMAEDKEKGLKMTRTFGQMIKERGVDVSQDLNNWPMSVSVVLKIVTQVTSSPSCNLSRQEYTIALLEGYQSEERKLEKGEGLGTPPVTPVGARGAGARGG